MENTASHNAVAVNAQTFMGRVIPPYHERAGQNKAG